jgi:hypothetical protein
MELRPATGLAVRLLGYANHANMGSYDEAIQGFLSGRDTRPDVVAHRAQGRVKTGVGLNTEYAFPAFVRVFARTGWNKGHNESFEYTEVNNSAQAGEPGRVPVRQPYAPVRRGATNLCRLGRTVCSVVRLVDLDPDDTHRAVRSRRHRRLGVGGIGVPEQVGL